MINPASEPVELVAPKPRHATGLAALSRGFAQETTWAPTIPVGQMTTEKAAESKLFGEDVLVARVAEAAYGRVVGFTGVYRHPEVVHISILVGADYRGLGLGRRLVEDAFEALPSGLEVEAWVGAFNQASLAAMPHLGFDLARTIEDRGRTVQIFARVS